MQPPIEKSEQAQQAVEETSQASRGDSLGMGVIASEITSKRSVAKPVAWVTVAVGYGLRSLVNLFQTNSPSGARQASQTAT